MFAQFIFQLHAFPDDGWDSGVLTVLPEHVPHPLVAVLVLDYQQDGSQEGEQQTARHGHAPPALEAGHEAQQQEGVVEGEVEAAHEDRDEDGGRQSQYYHRGEVGGVQEHVPGASGHSHQGHREEGVLEHIRIARC